MVVAPLWQAGRIVHWVRMLSWLVAAGGLLFGSGCSTKPQPGLPPLDAPSWRVELPVDGFEPAVVALPLGARAPRPIVVVLHGERDKAEWQCGSFRGLFGGQVFIVCPRGVRGEGGTYGLGRFDDRIAELRGGLAALKARFGAHVAKSSVVLVGYGEGAALAAELLRQEPSFFARVALVNGEPAALTPSAAKIFAERGGKRVLVFCTTDACHEEASQRALWLSRSGAQAKIAKASVGPYLDAAFVDALRGELPWLLDGDARFTSSR